MLNKLENSWQQVLLPIANQLIINYKDRSKYSPTPRR